MKTIADAAMAAIEAGEAVVTGAVEITPRDTGTVLRYWGGSGSIVIDGNTYLGLGDRAFAQQTNGAIGGVAQGITLGISGIELAALSLLDPDEVKAASVTLYRLIFASDCRTLLDNHVFDRGRGDTLNSVETIGGPAAIQYAVESAARSLGRSGVRMRTDPDQKLIDTADGYFKHTAYAGEITLFWGGKKSAAATVLSPPTDYGS